jgi:hypothetical protein
VADKPNEQGEKNSNFATRSWENLSPKYMSTFTNIVDISAILFISRVFEVMFRNLEFEGLEHGLTDLKTGALHAETRDIAPPAGT